MPYGSEIIAGSAEAAAAGEMTGGSATMKFGEFPLTDMHFGTSDTDPTGRNNKDEEETNDHLQDMYNQGKESVNYLKKISESIKGISPLLDQQIIILNKTIQLFLRPLLDSIGRFIQPFIIAIYKVVLDWYRTISKVMGTGTTTDLAKQRSSLEEQLQFAKEAGDLERAKRIEEQIRGVDEAIKIETARLKANLEKSSDVLSSTADPLSGLFIMIAASLGVFGDAVVSATNKISPNTQVAWTNPTTGDQYGTYTDENGNKVSGLIPKTIGSGGGTFSSGGGGSSSSGSSSSGGSGGFGSFFSDNRVSPGLSTGVSSAFTSPFNPNLTSKASGGPISSSGFYNLHAGEMVLNAGEVSMLKRNSGGGFSFNNTFNIQGGMNSESDIRLMARKLAEYQEVELRRRVSY